MTRLPLRPRAVRRTAGAAALLSALASGACAHGSLSPAPAPSPITLDERQVAHIATLLSFEDRRTFAPDTFAFLARDPSPEVRGRTALAAGRIGDPAALPVLLRMLGDADDRVRADAAFALGELGDSTPAAVSALERAAPSNWAVVRESDVRVGREVMAALGKIGTDDAREAVLRGLRELYPAAGSRPAATAEAALLAVWRFREGAGRVASVRPYLDHPDAQVRWRAAYALMRIGTPDAVAGLLQLAHDPDHRVRASVARGLRAGPADTAGVTDSARATLVRLLTDDHAHVRINALRALAAWPDPPVAVMAASLSDRDPNVVVAAATALGEAGEAAAPALDSLLRRDAAPLAARVAAAIQLAPFRPAAVVPVLETWSGGGTRERYAAARALAAVGWDRARDVLSRLAADADVRVAVAATQAAGALAADSSLAAPAAAGLHDLLRTVARSDRPRLAAVGLRALAPLLSPDDLPAVLDAYAAAITVGAAGPGSAAEPSAAAADLEVDSLGPDRREMAEAAVAGLAALDEAMDGRAGQAFRSRFGTPSDRRLARSAAQAMGGDSPTAPSREPDVLSRHRPPLRGPAPGGEGAPPGSHSHRGRHHHRGAARRRCTPDGGQLRPPGPGRLLRRWRLAPRGPELRRPGRRPRR